MAKPPAPKILSPAPIPAPTRNPNGSLPKVNRNDVLKAVQATFVRPAVQKVTSGFQAMNPVNIARNWANANPVTAKIIDFKANLDDNRQERDRPERERRAAYGSANDNQGWKNMRNGEGGGGGGIDAMSVQNIINALENILDSSTSGFANVTTELRAIRMSAVTTVRNTNLMLHEQKRNTSAVLEMVEHLKTFANGTKPTTEDKIEARSAVATQSETGEKAKNPLLELLMAAGSMALRWVSQLRVGAAALVASTRAALVGLGARIAGIFRGLRLPRALETLSATVGRWLAPLARVGRMFAPVGAFITRIGEFLAPMLKMFTPIMGLVGRLGGFLKFIPVVGQVIMLLMAAFDGIKGFIKGFSGTDGNFMEKLWGGFKGAITGIIQGLLSPFIWVGKMIWKGIKGLADILGLDKLAETIGKIDFGELFKKVVNLFKPTGNMFKELWEMFKEFISGIFNKVRETGGAIQNAVQTGANAAQDAADGIGRAARTNEDISRVGGVGGMLDRIAAGEGTSDADARRHGFASGYDVPLGYGRYGGRPSKPLSQMTMAEVDAYQRRMLADPTNPHNSSAVGRYQIVGTTLRGLRRDMGIRDDEVFDAAMQDRLGTELLRRRGMGRYARGEISERQFQLGLSQEWASIAKPGSRMGYYGGVAATDGGEIQAAIRAISETTRPNPANVTPPPSVQTNQQNRRITDAERAVRRMPAPAPAQTTVVNAPTNNTVNNSNGGGGNRTRYNRNGLDGYRGWGSVSNR